MRLDRFSAPLFGERESEVVAKCAACGEELLEGDEVIREVNTGEYFCDRFCYVEFLVKQGLIETVILERKGER